MKIDLDKFELYYLLESCFRGSHHRSSTILRFVDEVYPLLSEEDRFFYFRWIRRDIYGDDFKPQGRLCGADKIFMHRFDPFNQYFVTIINDKQEQRIAAYKMDGRYYVGSKTYIPEDAIAKIEKMYDTHN